MIIPFFRNKTPLLTLFLASILTAQGICLPSDPARKSQLNPAEGGIAVFPPNKEERWTWTLPPAHPAQSSATAIQWTLHYWDGTEARGEAPVLKPVPPAEVAPLAFVLTPAKLGWARLSVQLKDAKGKTLLSEETTLTVGAPDRNTQRAFHYGYCSHSDWLQPDQYKLSIQILGASGIDLLRDGYGWDHLQPAEGKWAFDKLDQLVTDTGAVGIELQTLFGYTAKWASTGNTATTNWHDWANKMPKIDPWLTYVKTMVERYGDRIHYWEVWNEPDHSFWLDTPENYLLLFNKTAEAIKKVSPSAKVMNGGLTLINTDQDIAVRKNLFTKGDKANWDLFAYHSYMTLEQLLATSKEVDLALKGTGLDRMPRWMNECGTHTLVPDGERTQLLQLIKKITLSPALGITGYFSYDLRDDGIDSSTTEHRLGVVDYYYRPRPAYAAYQNLIRELASRRYFPPGNAPAQPSASADGIWLAGYAGSKGAEHRIVAWREGKASAPTMLHWPKGTAIKGVEDAMGNPVEFSRVGGYAVVALSEEPVYIAFTGKAAYPELSSFIRLPAVVAALPGQTAPLAIGIRNPTADPLELTLKGRLADGGKELFNQTLQLAPGDDQEVKTNVSWPAEAAGAGKIGFEIASPSLGTSFHATLPYEAARVIPFGADPGEKMQPPQFVLNKRENIVNLSDGLAQADRDWKGPEDLSATSALSYDETALHLLIDVQDDIHSQQGNPLRLWEADGVQLAIKMNDADLNYLQAEIGLAPGKAPVTWVDKAPSSGQITLGALPSEVTCAVVQKGTHTVYRIDLPWATLGSKGFPKKPFRLSFLVNDNDGTGRRQWVELSPGIGKLQDPSLFPLFFCK